MDFAQLSKRYWGKTAENYEARRMQTAKWGREQAAVERILCKLPVGSSILDIPVGTGRFLETYRKLGLSAVGMDISTDMLRQADEKARQLDFAIDLRQGDVRSIHAADAVFDIALCVRFLNWIDLAGVGSALAELSRVSRRYLVISASHFIPFGDIDLLSRSGLRALLGQSARRFKTQAMRSARKRRIVFHEREALMRVFREADFTIAEAICTEPGSRGVASFIYLLEKRSAHQV